MAHCTLFVAVLVLMITLGAKGIRIDQGEDVDSVVGSSAPEPSCLFTPSLSCEGQTVDESARSTAFAVVTPDLVTRRNFDAFVANYAPKGALASPRDEAAGVAVDGLDTYYYNGGGVGPNGRVYKNLSEFWREALNDVSDGKTPIDIYDTTRGWYGRIQSYWAKEPATMRAVLGGTESVTHKPDIRETKRFMKALEERFGIRPGADRALDVGAGVGRISEHLLVKRFRTVDFIEQSPSMAAVVSAMLNTYHRLGEGVVASVERVQLPQRPMYDFIVIQFVAMYLTDYDLVAFLKQCKIALQIATSSEAGLRAGVILVKENIMHGNAFLVGSTDLAVNRCDAHYKSLFRQAGLEVVHEEQQKVWPEGYLPVKMYALR